MGYFAHNSLEFPVLLRFCDSRSGRLFFHFIATLARLLRLGPGGARSIVAERFLRYAGSPWTKTRNEIVRAGVLQFFIAARFGNLAVSLPQHQ